MNNSEIIYADSEVIAEWICAALDSGLTVSDNDGIESPVTSCDFLIVLRSKGHMSAYARALESRNIPFEISGSSGFAESQEMRMLLPFLKSVTDPDDSLSLLAFLRGPLCGASDSAIYSFKQTGGQFIYTVDPPDGTEIHLTMSTEALTLQRDTS